MAAKKGKSLIVVESPNKVKSISKYAGDDFIVKASVGHITELGGKGKGMGIDFRNQYEPSFALLKDKAPVVADLKMAAKKCQRVLIATDADREGEAIGWHVMNQLGDTAKEIRRMTFTEITKGAIQEALKEKNLRDLNLPLVDAQIARQILDKIIGFKVSPILWIALRNGLSAGRVQSVALRFIVDRHKEIQAFVPEEYWYLDAELTTSKKESLVVRLITKDKDNRIWGDKTKVDPLLKDLAGATYKVSDVSSKKTTRSPQAPFSTSALQQAAGSILGWTPKKTMEVAQKLYEGYGSGGFITYHRTDSLNISKEASALAQIYIKQKFGGNYQPKKVPNYGAARKKKQQKKAKKGQQTNAVQESHEAIRPTDINRDPSFFQEKDHKKLYELIWRKFLSSQMAPAEFDSATIEVKAKKHKFKANGSRILFDGFLKVWTYTKNTDSLLPDVKKGEELDLLKLNPSQHETKPPERFTSSSIVKTLEDKGIGRPSTYAGIIDTLQKRKYVNLKGKAFEPTDLGIEVCDHLVLCKFDFMDAKFTSLVENALDEIAKGELDRPGVIDLFWQRLRDNLKYAQTVQDEKEKTEYKCPKCKRPLLLKSSRKGKKFFGCSGYSDKSDKCDHIMEIGEDGKPKEIVVESLDKKCPKCGGNIIKRDGRFGSFYGCDNYPACKTIFDENGKIKTKPKPKKSGEKCEKCGSDMVIRHNRKDKSEFLGCSNYPKCKNAKPISKEAKS